MTQPDAVDALTIALRRDMAAVWAQIVAEQTALEQAFLGLNPPERLTRLRQLETRVRDLTAQAQVIATQGVVPAVQGAYTMGAVYTAVAAGIGPSAVALDYDAIRILAQDTMSDLLHATQHVNTTTKNLVRTLSRDSIRSKLYTGRTATDAARRLAIEFAENGIHAVTYTNGARVGLSQYADMVVRTKTAVAYQAGGFDQGESLDIEYWEVMDGPFCGWTHHDDPDMADGKIVTLDEAREWPISHPNCRRSSSPRADRETPEDAVFNDTATTENAAQNKALTEQYWRDVEARKSRAKGRVKTPNMGTQTAAQSKHANMLKRLTPST